MLEENFIEGYTVIPKFGQIGFEIAALTFVKSKLKCETGDKKAQALQKMKEWYMKQTNVIMVMDGRGMGWDAVCISLHENFASFAQISSAHTTLNYQNLSWKAKHSTLTLKAAL